MDITLILIILVFANSLALLFVLVVSAMMLFKLNMGLSELNVDIETSLTQMTRAIEQQSRLFEHFITKARNG